MAEISPSADKSTFTRVIVATGIAGVAGYLITWLVARQIGFASYAVFAVFWAFLYLVIGSLSGIQQEVTRATRQASTRNTDTRLRNFGLAGAALVFVLIVATSPAWARELFSDEGYDLVVPLAVGTGSYVLTAVLSGILYGISRWRPLALIIMIDPLVRLGGLLCVLPFTHNVQALAWAVAAPVPLTFAAVWLFWHRAISGHFVVDVGYRSLSWNVLRIIVAAAALSLMVSGFPLVLGLTSQGENPSSVGLLILAVTLTRAPLIVTVMSLQSLLIVRFRDKSESFWRTLLALGGLLFGAAAVLALLGWLIGPTVFVFLFPDEAVPAGWLIAGLVASSALVGAMCVTAAANLAKSHHFTYSIGWVFAALMTIVILLTPFDLTTRTLLALIVGPICGLIVHSIGLVRSRSCVRGSSAS